MKTRKKIEKTAVVIGGLIIMVGTIMLGTSALAFLGIFDPNLFLDEGPRAVFIWMLFILGVIDFISGIILWSGE